MKLFSIHTSLRVVLVCLSIGFGLSACGPGTHYSEGDTQFFASENPYAPIIKLQGDNPYFHEVKTAFVDPGFSARSLSDGDLSSNVFVQSGVNADELGEFEVTYSVLSKEGLLAQVKRKVVVRDTTAPNLSLNGASEQILERTGQYVELGYLANDNYDSDSSLNVSVTGSVDSLQIGTYTLHYQVTDSSGNSSSLKSRIIHVVDTTPPVISITQPSPAFIVNAFNQWVIVTSGLCSEEDQEVSVTNTVDSKQVDCVDGHWSATLNFTGLADGPVSIIAQQHDEADNPSEVLVNGLKDTEAASLSIVSPLSGFYVNQASQSTFVTSGTCSEIDQPVNVTNGVDNRMVNCEAGFWLASLNFSGVTEGAISIQVSHQDLARNTPGTDRVNGVLDRTPPTVSISAPANLIVNIASGEQIQTSGTCSENNRQVSIGNGADTKTPLCVGHQWSTALNFSALNEGSIYIHADLMDAAGNSAIQASLLGNKDIHAPVITINGGNPTQVNLCESYSDAGASAIDNLDGSVPVQTDNPVDTLVAANYQVIYSAEDAAGNPAEGIRDVSVLGLDLDGFTYSRGLSTRTHVEAIANVPAANYALCSDIDFNANEDFVPIALSFQGKLHGQGFKFINITIHQVSDNEVGIFSNSSSNALIRNLILDGVIVEGRDSVGSLVGLNHGKIRQVRVQNASVSGSETGSAVGGLVGLSEKDAEIREASVVFSTVRGEREIGGLVGKNRGEIHDSFSAASVTSTASSDSKTGGLVGKMDRMGGDNPMVVHSYSQGFVEGIDSVGGLIGENSYNETVVASTWDTETSGVEGPSSDEDRYGIPLTTVEMQTESTFDLLGWNLISIWLVPVSSYPEHFWYQP